MQNEVSLKVLNFAGAWKILEVRCRSDGRVKAATLVLESNFANTVARVSFLSYWWRYCHSWGEGGRSSRLSWVVAKSEPNRLDATKRLLVFSSG